MVIFEWVSIFFHPNKLIMHQEKAVIKDVKEILKRLIKPGNSVGGKTVKGGVWVFSLRIFMRLFQLTRTVILARLLSPNDFGLFGISLLTLSMLETFSQTGFRRALIQKKGDLKSYLDSVWTAEILRGCSIATILFLSAPYIAKFFNTHQAESIIKVIGSAIVLQGLTNIAVIYFEKEMEFHKYFAFYFAGTIVDIATAIGAAFLLRSVWALVLGFLSGNLTRCIISYVVHPYRPQFNLNFKKTKELWIFGRWIFSSSVLVFLVTQGDDILVGKLLGVMSLGFYQVAYRISNLPSTEITQVFSQVTLPAYSKLQDNIPKLREAYLKVLQMTTFLSFPTAGLIFTLAHDFVRIILGEKWMPIVPAIQILVFAGLVRSIAATTGPIFLAVGKPKIDTQYQLVRLFVLAILLYPFTFKFGIAGTSFVVFLSIFISSIGNCYSVIKITECEVKSFGKVMILPLMISLISISPLFALKMIIDINGVVGLGFLFSIAILIVVIITHLFDIHLNYGMKSLITESLKLLREI